jgi:hypothetical protein
MSDFVSFKLKKKQAGLSKKNLLFRIASQFYLKEKAYFRYQLHLLAMLGMLPNLLPVLTEFLGILGVLSKLLTGDNTDLVPVLLSNMGDFRGERKS